MTDDLTGTIQIRLLRGEGALSLSEFAGLMSGEQFMNPEQVSTLSPAPELIMAAQGLGEKLRADPLNTDLHARALAITHDTGSADTGQLRRRSRQGEVTHLDPAEWAEALSLWLWVDAAFALRDALKRDPAAQPQVSALLRRWREETASFHPRVLDVIQQVRDEHLSDGLLLPLESGALTFPEPPTDETLAWHALALLSRHDTDVLLLSNGSLLESLPLFVPSMPVTGQHPQGFWKKERAEQAAQIGGLLDLKAARVAAMKPTTPIPCAQRASRTPHDTVITDRLLTLSLPSGEGWEGQALNTLCALLALGEHAPKVIARGQARTVFYNRLCQVSAEVLTASAGSQWHRQLQVICAALKGSQA